MFIVSCIFFILSFFVALFARTFLPRELLACRTLRDKDSTHAVQVHASSHSGNIPRFLLCLGKSQEL